MTVIGNKFYINITAKSKEELNKRIEDNLERGFVLHKINDIETKTYRNVDYKVDGGGYTQYGKITKEYDTKITAVMYREGGRSA